MIEIEVNSTSSFLGTQHMAAGDTERFLVTFADLLAPGILVTEAHASVTSNISTVVSPCDLVNDQTAVSLLVTSATLGETFTLALLVFTNDSQRWNFTIAFQVDNPVIVTVPSTNPLVIGAGSTGPTGPVGPPGFTVATGSTGPTGDTGARQHRQYRPDRVHRSDR
jgi:hypothetical protein